MNQLNIHPDFRAIKGRELATKQWQLTLMNGLLSTVNALANRKFGRIVTAEKIPGIDGFRVPLLMIRPETLETPSAALVYFHGGAFIMRNAPQHVANAVRYAQEANCCVIFVQYRLAPKHPFPAGFNDCYAALQWAFTNAGRLAIDKQRIAVGGDSAGGAMAASAAQKAAHEGGIKLCGQLLIYPVTDCDGKWPSTTQFANVPPFKGHSSQALWAAYLSHPVADGVPKYAAPIRGDLSSLAPAYVETAEFDILRDEGRAYAQALLAKGVEVFSNETRGTVHGFDLMAARSAISKEAMEKRIGFLRKVFRSKD